MVYKGSFKFDKSNHPGECQISKDNNIYLIINESDFNGYKRKIEGYADNKYLKIYDCRLVDNGKGFYKYQVAYLVDGTDIKIGKVDFINNIQDFRFTFDPLEEWLNIDTLESNDNSIKINIPDDIYLYDKDGIKIKIKYFREENVIFGNTIEKLKIRPYICIETTKIMKVDRIKKYVQMVTRFFALLMGFTGNVNNIKFHKRYNGEIIMQSIEDNLIINVDFSNCYGIRDGYSSFRTNYNDCNGKLDILFSKWFETYEKYEEAINLYFIPYKANLVEEEFLNISKCLEKISIAKEDKKAKIRKNKQFHKIIEDFYKKHKLELINNLKKSSFKKKYIDNIDEIHEEIANGLVYKYSHRVTLSKRIKDLDSDRGLIHHFENRHITKYKDTLTIYDYIANTRNYYTHLDNCKFILKNKYIPEYCRIMEKILIKEMLKFIIDDANYIDEKLKKDNYLTVYDEFGF